MMRQRCSDPSGLIASFLAVLLLGIGGIQLFLALASRAVPSNRALRTSVWVLAGWSACACVLIMAGGLAFLGAPFRDFSFADNLWFLAFAALPLAIALALLKRNEG